MFHRGSLLACASAVLAVVIAAPAHADPMLRKQVDQHGDFVLFGNTLAFECASGGSPAVPAPVVGTVGMCPDANQTAPDVYFRADEPAVGQCAANASITGANARSTAVLKLPDGAKVTYARLYWGALFDGTAPDNSVVVERPATGLRSMITSDASARLTQGFSSDFWYVSSADVTELVQQQGPGAFRVGDVSSINIVNLGSLYPFVGWYMVVFYEREADPVRNLALFDGMDLIEAGSPKSVQLRGFLVPSSGFDGKLGVVAVEGDPLLPGDALSFDMNTLSDAQNPADNFFNASRSNVGMAVSNEGDLPRLTGGPRSMSGLDMDVVSVTQFVRAGQTSATLAATTFLDTYILTAFVTSVSTLKPDFARSEKTQKDLNGGRLLPNEELEYELTLRNTGSDASKDTIVRDPLPAGVTLVPGSIEIVSGPNMGKKTDAADGDQAEYDSAMRRIVVRLGMNASGTAGGSVANDSDTKVRFRVKIDEPTRGRIENQAIVTAGGQRGSASEDAKTDSDATVDGPQTTGIVVDECATDADCKAPKKCDISQSPQICTECVTSDDCKDKNAPDCNTMTHTCECTRGQSQCKDTDGDGISDGGEDMLGTDPKDADTDDDGTRDGAELAPDQDSDGDGVINALDADSDNDGLFDGTEQGFDCNGPDTDKTKKRCRPDADRGATTTNPTRPDTDGGGVNDGSEDSNLNGTVDTGETNPIMGREADDAKKDRDNDGLSDALEGTLKSNADDADTDDDGTPDGAEANPSEDTDLDGRINVLDVDSDNDTLYDGTEVGRHCADAATDAAKKHCKPDGDMGKTKTSALLADTDKGGALDGSEDVDGNGVLDMGELDPTKGHGADDRDAIDTDKDKLSDGREKVIGTDANDADSDDDGAIDGDEPNPADDNDGDGKIDALDHDSDDDGLFDGLELGRPCSNPATQITRNQCTADADSGVTTTSPLAPDTDAGGKTDGFEDFDKNGRVDSGELNPNDPADDNRGDVCEKDSDCGDPASGRICVDHKCQPGCRGMGGNSCPTGQMCTSTTMMAGMCTANPPEPDAGLFVPGQLGGGGCDCRVAGVGGQASDDDANTTGLLAFSAVIAFWFWSRSRKRQSLRRRRY